MPDASASAGPSAPPGPQDRPAGTPNVNALLGLVQKLILFGQSLLDSLRIPVSQAEANALEFCFGTSDVRLIVGRIVRGLHRATALQLRLRERAASGRDIRPSRPGESPPPPHGGKRRRRRDPEQPQDVTLTDAELQRILQEARRRPIGSVLTDLAIAFGLMPGMCGDTALLCELADAVMKYRGSLDRWYAEGRRYLRRSGEQAHKPAAAKRGAPVARAPESAPNRPATPAPAPAPPPGVASPVPHDFPSSPPADPCPPLPAMMPPPMPEPVPVAAGPP